MTSCEGRNGSDSGDGRGRSERGLRSWRVVTDPEGEALEVFLGENGDQMPVRFSIEGERVIFTPCSTPMGQRCSKCSLATVRIHP